jgi:uncharacterized phage infection (PIP) family protein YhgE
MINILSGFRSFWSGLKPATKRDLKETENHIMAKVSDLNDILKEIGDKLAKAQTEIVGEISALKTALGDATIPAEAQASLDRLNTLAQALDDLNPDVAPESAPAPAAPAA